MTRSGTRATIFLRVVLAFTLGVLLGLVIAVLIARQVGICEPLIFAPLFYG